MQAVRREASSEWGSGGSPGRTSPETVKLLFRVKRETRTLELDVTAVPAPPARPGPSVVLAAPAAPHPLDGLLLLPIEDISRHMARLADRDRTAVRARLRQALVQPHEQVKALQVMELIAAWLDEGDIEALRRLIWGGHPHSRRSTDGAGPEVTSRVFSVLKRTSRVGRTLAIREKAHHALFPD